MSQPDAVYALVQPLNIGLALSLAGRWGIPGWAGVIAGLLGVAEFAVLVALLCGVAMRLRGAARPAAAVVAAAVFLWSARIGGDDLATLFGRWDHLVFCAAAGYAIAGLSSPARRWLLSAISLYFVVAHFHVPPIALLGAGALLGLALLGLPGTQRPARTALVQGAVLLGMFAAIWAVRRWSISAALSTQGAFGFVLLRHISFVVETRRGRPAGLGNYLCYLFFYPSFIGASEIYSEFHERNLSSRGVYDYRFAGYKLVTGQLLLWAALQFTLPFEQVIQIRQPLTLWGSVLASLLLSGLFVMGLWSTIEGLALLYGIRLRPNFPAVLTRTNPAEFWRAWRGTMTNWLIHYVYIPLGGNRRRQQRNIGAAFAVSVAWHWMGIPFHQLGVSAYDFAPIALWGLINAGGVTGYVLWRRRGQQVLPATLPQPLRTATKIALTWVFASFTVTLLTFTPRTMTHFAPFVRTLLGFPP